MLESYTLFFFYFREKGDIILQVRTVYQARIAYTYNQLLLVEQEIDITYQKCQGFQYKIEFYVSFNNSDIWTHNLGLSFTKTTKL